MSRTFLDIRTVHILSGDGETADLRNVRCPARQRQVTLERCLACEQSAGVAHDPKAHAERLSCRHAGAGDPARGTRGAEDVPVSAVMTTDVLAVRPDVSLDAVTELLLERGFGGVPVVDDGGRPIGILSKTDLVDLRFVAGDPGEAPAQGVQPSRGRYRVEIGRGVHAEAPAGGSVEDAMTHAALTVREDAPLAQAAALMVTRGVHRLLVVAEDGTLSGILADSDVVRWVAERGGRLPVQARA